jgi:hypothetical protein
MRPLSYSLRLAIAGATILAVAACGSSASTAPPSAMHSEDAMESVSEPTETANAADAYPFLSAYEGHFAGSWSNETFATTGPMAWDISADESARTVMIVVDVGGNFFGGPGAPAETIVLTHLADGVIQGTSPAFGDISGTLSPDGMLDITLSSIPGGAISKVTITGILSGGNSIALDYAVAFTAGGAEATGTVTLMKEA